MTPYAQSTPTRGAQMRDLHSDVGGRAAPGFFERIRQRETLQQQAQDALQNELKAARMIRSAYRAAVSEGRFNPAVLSAYGELNAARGRRQNQKSGTLNSDLDVIAEDLEGLANATDKEERAKNPMVYNPDLAKLQELQTQLLGRSTFDAANALRDKAIQDGEVKLDNPFDPVTFGLNPNLPFYPAPADKGDE